MNIVNRRHTRTSGNGRLKMEPEASLPMSATAVESGGRIPLKRLSGGAACRRAVHVSVIIIGIILSVEIVGLYECSYLRVEVAPMDIGRIELA